VFHSGARSGECSRIDQSGCFLTNCRRYPPGALAVFRKQPTDRSASIRRLSAPREHKVGSTASAIVGPNRCCRSGALYHRVAISNRPIDCMPMRKGVTFKWKDYRAEDANDTSDDARNRRVHPPLPHSRAAAAPSHPLLRLLASPSSCCQHRRDANCSQCVTPIDALNAAALIRSRKHPASLALLRRPMFIIEGSNAAQLRLPTSPPNSDQTDHHDQCQRSPCQTGSSSYRAAHRNAMAALQINALDSSLVHPNGASQRIRPCASTTQHPSPSFGAPHRCGTAPFKSHS